MGKKYAYINGIILDGSRDMKPVNEKIILTDGERIEAVVEKNSAPSGYEAVDLKGRYIMPGLINLHVHLPASGKPKKKPQDPVKLVKLITGSRMMRKIGVKICEKAAKTQLMSGVTTIRTVGGVSDFDTVIRDKIEEGLITGPRIVASNMAISVEGGHMVHSLAYAVHSVEEAREQVSLIAADKPDLIKLMITGGVLDAKAKGEPGEVKMPAQYVKAVCERAHELGLKTAAHVESPEGVKRALENGVDTIEHGAKPDEEMMSLFKEHGSCLVATLSPALPFALFDRSVSNVSETEQYNGKLVFDGIIECAKACLREGIPVGLGTDTGCPYVTHYDMWRELNYFKKFCGVSNSFALHTITKINAEIAGIGDVTGCIEAGKCADFVVTEENPLEDLKALRNISMVVARGRIVDAPKVRKINEVEMELDKFI
mgnify:CR=1 FL=1